MMLTGIRQMEMMDVPDPLILQDTDVLIKMKVLGVCGSDVHYYNTGRIGSQVVTYPFPVGHEGAGEVISTGKAVKRVRPGERVAIEPAMPCFECDQCLAGRTHTCRKLKFLGCPGQANGCLSEYIVMPETSCLPISEKLSYDEAVISEPLAIGLYAVRQSIDIKGKKVGILGFGPIGMSVLLPAIVKGADKVYVSDKIDERLSVAIKSGATWTGNVLNQDIVGEISSLEPALLDVVFECCGQQDAMDQAVQLIRPGGKIMIIGIPEFDTWTFKVDELRRKEITLTNVRRQNECTEDALRMMATGEVDVSYMPTHRFPFERAKEAFDLVAGYKDGVMKAMIDFP